MTAPPKAKLSRRTTFTELSVRKLAVPDEGQVDHIEKLRRGLTLQLRLSYGGTKAWRVIYYANGKPHAKTLGHWPELSAKAAKEAAYDFDPKAGAAAARAGSFKAVAESWIKHYVDEKRLRSKLEIERHLRFYIYPEWERKPFFEIRRGAVSDLLDKIAKKHGRPQADAVLATIRSITNWYATRDEDYTSPIVKGMRRDKRKPKDRARNRVLTDREIRQLWKAAETSGTFGAIVRLLLLTAQRREKVARMRWEDVDEDLWSIATEEGEKGNAGKLRLPTIALDIIQKQPVIDNNPFVFAGSLRGRRHARIQPSGPPAFNSWSQCKAELNEKLPVDMPHWTVHDLRRTARSLLSRAGVQREIAERLLGHAISGVEGIYDRHSYVDEKADGLSRLATLIEVIVNPPDTTNVIQIAARQ